MPLVVGGLENRCEVCYGIPVWLISRHEDGVVISSCAAHLSESCQRLQVLAVLTGLVESGTILEVRVHNAPA
jgi:hypothetical protein